MRKLHISQDLALPAEAVTSTFVVYGGKGMGKTNFGAVFAEELSRSRLRFSVIDPVGVWWGLRNSRDGESPGIELLILGGVKGDIPIEPTGGAVVADLVADESVNVLIDISRHANGKMWSIGERIRFVRDYFVRLYARQGEKRQPLTQILDEAARFCPQTIRKNEDDIVACLAAVAVMVEEGRNVGVGMCLLTQRSARLNKDVAELADCMIAFRIVGPNSINAVMDWFGEHIPKERWKGLIEILRKLPVGRALVVSPGWLEFEGEAQIRPRETFDSSATPKPGEKVKTPRGAAAKPDLSKYQERMAATIERAKENDPKALKKEIQRLTSELAKKDRAGQAQKSNTAIKPDPKQQIRAAEFAKARRALEEAMKFIVEISTKNFDASVNEAELRKAIDTAVEQALAKIEAIVASRSNELGELKKRAAALLTRMKAVVEADIPVKIEVRHNEPFTVSARALAGMDRSVASLREGKVSPVVNHQGDTDLPPRRQRILDALAFYESIGQDTPAREWVAFFNDTSPSSSTYEKDCGAMRRAGLITYPSHGLLQLTTEGRALARPAPALTLPEFHEKVLNLLEPRRKRLLSVLIDSYPDELRRDQLAERVVAQFHEKCSADSSTFEKDLGAMRTAGLLIYPQSNYARAAALLFPPLPA